MKTVASLLVIFAGTLFFAGCGGSAVGPNDELPVNTGVSDEAASANPDAGVATDESAMAGGAAQGGQ